MRTVFAACLLLAACGPGPQDEANLPGAPGTTVTGDVPQPTPPGSVTPCTILAPEASTAAQTALPSAGSAAGWTINGDTRLVCSEPGLGGAVGCELAPGGAVVASKADKAYGFKNDTASPLSISVNTEGMTCGPLQAPA
jgi:hypothetical protein